MRIQQRFRYLAATGLLVAFSVVVASPVAVSVPGTATGGFGGVDNSGFTDLVPAFRFAGPGRISISATGVVDFNRDVPGFESGPDGGPVSFDVPLDVYTPLEEGRFDEGLIELPRPAGTVIANAGALIGVFISESLASTTGFLARDEDLTTAGVPADELFLVGAGPFVFDAQQAGTLFLGVNDGRAINNDGQFEVNIVPISGALMSIIQVLLLDDG